MSSCVGPKEQQEQAAVATVQALAMALSHGDRAVACGLAVKEHRTEVLCDVMIQTLLHYSPGFAGAKVTYRGQRPSALSWYLRRKTVLPLHYESKAGQGNLDVTLRFEENAYRIVSVLPVK